MNRLRIELSSRAYQRFEDITDYLYEQNLSKQFVVNYINQFENWLETTLVQFPESGTLMPEYGEGVRRIIYQKYSFIYRVDGELIKILTLYRENLP